MPTKIQFSTEADLAKLVVAWLESLGWDVYQEVQPFSNGVADIVAINGAALCVVECKLSMGLRVLSQADDWRRSSNMTYVAVPAYSRNRDERFAFGIARLLGIGVLQVRTGSIGRASSEVTEAVRPEIRRRCQNNLREVLSDKQKTFAAAGNSEGKRWTPFQNTYENVRNYVRSNPGAPMKKVIDNIKTHYSTPSSAKQSLLKWIENGSVEGLGIERIGRTARVWLK